MNIYYLLCFATVSPTAVLTVFVIFPITPKGSAGDGVKGTPRFSSHKPPRDNTGATTGKSNHVSAGDRIF